MDTTPPQGVAMGQSEGSKLPPVLAKLMDNLSSSSYRSPQVPNAVSNAAAPPVNVQELLSSIMVSTRWPLPVLVLLLAALRSCCSLQKLQSSLDALVAALLWVDL